MENRQDKFQLGMIGLGVMGRNLVLNMVEHGCTVAGYDKDLERVRLLGDEGGQKVFAAETIKDFINALSTPRIIMMLVPAGPPVDAVLGSLRPYLRHGDIVIDGGNSLFSDTRLRQIMLAEDGISLLGVGISGGAEGARHGPSIMPGGPSEAYELVRPIFQAIAAKVDGEPCVTYC
jgi:6-phosphogluconate dehydrogenase